MLLDSIRLEWDSAYGTSHRRGWSVKVNGIVEVQFVSLWRALVVLLKAWRQHRRSARAS